MRKLIKPTLYSFMALSLLTGCGEESVYELEPPIVTAEEYQAEHPSDRRDLYSKTFKEVQAFLKDHKSELTNEEYEKLRTVLTGKGVGGKLPEGITVGDILTKKKYSY